jgi:cytochrome b subunit of formate dehydrogenase
MRSQTVGRWTIPCLGAILVAIALPLRAQAPSDAAAKEDAACLTCHDGKSQKIEVPVAGGKPRALHSFAPDKLAQSVHAKLACTTCHTGATAMPSAGSGHADRTVLGSASCVDCHTRLLEGAKKAGTAAAKPRLGVVVDNIETYKQSFHARPGKTDKSKPLASCDGCHDTHTFDIPPAASPAHAQWRLKSPATCGKDCHSEALEAYTDSVHGKELLEKGNAKSAVCADCHTAHAVGNTSGDPFKLSVTATCGNCHADNYKSYKATYHGQISTLGYAYTAKCYNCHGSHDILPVKDPDSRVSAANRMDTCKECHSGKKELALAPAGFASFQPHATTNDFSRYPQVWIAWQMMVGLLVGTFGFFWLHTAMWFYREYKDRQAQKMRPRVLVEALPPELRGKHFRRFSGTWRLAHILFALSLMLLTLTGMPLFYPDSAWAPWVMNALGGPKVAGIIHRVNAVVFAGVFFWHLVYVAMRIWRSRKTFRWFGPDSLIPNWQDLRDIVSMFKWFVGKGPRPVFDRWTYWEKFDYWAPFWGVTIIGVSGLVMWLPHVTGAFLPGWVFNVAAIFHGEEAFLAVVFLFTVHFFNNHFRPDKFPVEIVMFTGTMSLEHVIREHPLEYKRLVESGELEKYLVDAPSAPMTLASKLFGFALIVVGLTLLFGVAVGFFGVT